jgi:hypothetical protein
MSNSPENENVEMDETFVEGVDFYFEDGLMVLTRHYLLKRGFCCKSGCRHCPYGFTPDGSQ